MLLAATAAAAAEDAVSPNRARMGGTWKTQCRRASAATRTWPPHSQTVCKLLSTTRHTSALSSMTARWSGFPGRTLHLRPLGRHCARLGLPGPFEDGGMDELLEYRLTRYPSNIARSINSGMTTRHRGTVGVISTTPASSRATENALASLTCTRPVSQSNQNLATTTSSRSADPGRFGLAAMWRSPWTRKWPHGINSTHLGTVPRTLDERSLAPSTQASRAQ